MDPPFNGYSTVPYGSGFTTPSTWPPGMHMQLNNMLSKAELFTTTSLSPTIATEELSNHVTAAGVAFTTPVVFTDVAAHVMYFLVLFHHFSPFYRHTPPIAAQRRTLCRVMSLYINIFTMRPELGCRAVYFNRLAACSETLFFSCTAPGSIYHLHHLQEQKQQQRHTSSISTTCFSLAITPQRLLCSTLLAYLSIAFVNSLLCSPHFGGVS